MEPTLTKKPSIHAGDDHLDKITGEAVDALCAANDPPCLFNHGELIARIDRDQETNAAIVRTVTTGQMLLRLAEVADWYRRSRDRELPARPPNVIAQVITEARANAFPRLTRLVTFPVLLPDGRLHTERGYDRSSGIYYEPPPGFELPPLPEEPTAEDVREAVRLLLSELMGDFPFVSDADRAAALVLKLLPIVRSAIDGCTPLHFIYKPAAGTGASLLAEAIGLAVTGYDLAGMGECTWESETQRRLTAKLAQAPTFVFLDNLNEVDSATLSAAITLPIYEDRIIKTGLTLRTRPRCAWVATGNNPLISTELMRRSVPCRLDAKVAKPWMRDTSKLKHSNLLEWVRANRPQIVRALLVLVQAWLRAGRPAPAKTLGGMEAWSNVMGGILRVAEVPGFLDNLEEFYADRDREYETWCAFVAAWSERFADQPVGVKPLAELIVELALPVDLGMARGHGQHVKLGKHLSRLDGRIFGEHRIARAGEKHRATQWGLVRIATG